MNRRSPSAYTVFTPDGSPRRNAVGLVAFSRLLRDAVKQAEEGDYIQGWSSSGSPLARYGSNGRRIAS
jgi:hypothetical protein